MRLHGIAVKMWGMKAEALLQWTLTWPVQFSCLVWPIPQHRYFGCGSNLIICNLQCFQSFFDILNVPFMGETTYYRVFYCTSDLYILTKWFSIKENSWPHVFTGTGSCTRVGFSKKCEYGSRIKQYILNVIFIRNMQRQHQNWHPSVQMEGTIQEVCEVCSIISVILL